MSRGRVQMILALLLLNYIGGYFALSDPSLCGIDIGGGGTTWRKPHYRIGGEPARAVYRPLEMLDKQVRPAFWAPHDHTSVILVYEGEPELRNTKPSD